MFGGYRIHRPTEVVSSAGLYDDLIIMNMNFFGRTRQRTPSELVRGLRDSINRLDTGAPGGETRRKVIVNFQFTPRRGADPVSQANEDVSKYLTQIKSILYGDGGTFKTNLLKLPR